MAAQTLASSLTVALSSFSQLLKTSPQTLSFKPLAVLASSCSVSPLLRTARPFELGFVTRVVMSDLEMEQGGEFEGEDGDSMGEEDSFGEEEEEEVRAPVVRDDSQDLRLFVGNLPYTVDSAQLAGIFGDIGEVEMVEVIYDKITGRSRGFGFVTMSSAEEAASAVRKLDGSMVEGRDIRVRSGPPPPKDPNSSFGSPARSFNNRQSSGGYSQSGGGGGYNSSQSDDSRVYVGNLSWGVDESALNQLFSEQGKVVDAKVIYDRETGRSRGFGFVTFESAGDASNAINSLDGAMNQLFSEQGKMVDAKVIYDREMGRSRGFGFVTFESAGDASNGINSLDGADLDGRSIRVTIAEQRQRRSF